MLTHIRYILTSGEWYGGGVPDCWYYVEDAKVCDDTYVVANFWPIDVNNTKSKRKIKITGYFPLTMIKEMRQESPF